MNQDPVDQVHGHEAESPCRDREHERALVEAMFRAALEAGHVRPRPPEDIRPGVPYTDLSALPPGEPLAAEWNTYRREVGGWLAEGREGEHVLIKGEAVIGFFATQEDAFAEGLKRYLGEAFFIHPIRTEEPYVRVRGVNYPWPGSLSR